MRALYTIGGMIRSQGGPVQMVAQLCEALAEQGCEVVLATGEAEDEALPGKGLRMVRLAASSVLNQLERICAEEAVDLIHNHGLWLGINHAAAVIARQRKLPLVTTTHGMLRPWALRNKRWKKWLAWRLYQRRDLITATILHATAYEESSEYIGLGLKVRASVIPIGINPPPYPATRSARMERRTVLFMGRLHPVKGLMNLIGAIDLLLREEKAASPLPLGQRPKWHCIIAGPDEGGYRDVLEERIQRLGIREHFSFPGQVPNDRKWDLFGRADVVVLPSHTENFGIVVPEALSCGVPVIASRRTPWRDLEEWRCGWWVELGERALADALGAASALTPEAFFEMGRRGRELVKAKYTWPSVAKQMKQMYESIISGAVG